MHGADLSRAVRRAAGSLVDRLLDLPPLATAPLQRRYEHIRDASVPLERRWPAPPAALVPLLCRLGGLGVLLVAEPLERAQLARTSHRLGLTVSLPGAPTVIWVNYDAHVCGPAQALDVAEIIDTIAHEAVHATATMLGRCLVLPEGGASDAYRAEEVCAMVGTAEIHRSLGQHTLAQANEQGARREAGLLKDPSLRARAIRHGRKAARFLLDPAATAADSREMLAGHPGPFPSASRMWRGRR